METRRRKLLLVFTLPLFLLFLLQTIHAKVQPNWPVLATVPGLILLAAWSQTLVTTRRLLTGLLIVGCILNATASLMLHNTHLVRAAGLPLRLKIDPTKDLMGWPDLGHIVSLALRGMDPRTVILTTRYQTTAALAFHTRITERPGSNPRAEGRNPGHPLVLYLNPGDRRINQYDFWPWPADMANRLVLYVAENVTLPPAVSSRFGRCQPYQRAVIEEHGQVTRSANLFLCWQYRGT